MFLVTLHHPIASRSPVLAKERAVPVLNDDRRLGARGAVGTSRRGTLTRTVAWLATTLTAARTLNDDDHVWAEALLNPGLDFVIGAVAKGLRLRNNRPKLLRRRDHRRPPFHVDMDCFAHNARRGVVGLLWLPTMATALFAAGGVAGAEGEEREERPKDVFHRFHCLGFLALCQRSA